MRNFLKYSGFCLREREIPCTPVGPDFNWAGKKSYKLCDSKLTLRLPRHDPGKLNFKAENPKGDQPKEGRYEKSDDPNGAWKYNGVMRRYVTFYGPRFTGHMAGLYISIGSARRINHPDGVSFFHPKAFEQAIMHELNSSNGYEQDEGKPKWQAPVNWKVINGLKVPTASFDLIPIESVQHPSHLVYFPVSDNTLIVLSFSFSHQCNGFLEQRDREIDRSNMIKLVDDIVGSMELELSDEAKQQLAAAQADCPDPSVTKEFPPLKWPVYIDENGKESEDIKRQVLTNNFS